jgi:hypothetical protein
MVGRCSFEIEILNGSIRREAKALFRRPVPSEELQTRLVE